MTQTWKKYQDLSAGFGTASKGLLEVLGPCDQSALNEILRATPKSSSKGHSSFFGHPFFVSAFELESGKILRVKEAPSRSVALALATASNENNFCAHGAMTKDHLIICFGLADWTGRLLVISRKAFDDFLASEWPDLKFPPAERRMLQQLLIGLSSVQAAKADKVSYETKRTYVKLLCRRLSVSGQVELVSAVLGRLLIAINTVSDNIPADQKSNALNTYKKNFLPTSGRVIQLLDQYDRKIKILDIGSQTGRPIMVVHSTILPFFSEEMRARLTNLNLRLLIPLRPGIFEPQFKVLSSQDFTSYTLEGLALCKSLLAGQNAPVLGISTGGGWAVQFAQKHPELVPNLFLASMTLQSPKRETLLDRFLASFFSLAAKQPALIRLYVDFMLKQHRDPTRFRAMNDKVFPPGTIDGEAMAWEFSQPGALEAYMHFYHSSPSFLKSAARENYVSDTREISELSCNVHFIHGRQNTRDGITTIQDLVSTLPNAQITELAEAGHILRGKNLNAVWDLLAKNE